MHKALWATLRKAFRDNYLAAIGAVVLLLCSMTSSAQIFQYPNLGTYGTGQHRLSVDSVLYLPSQCGAPTGTADLHSYGFTGFGQKLKQIAILGDTCGHHVYWFDPTNSTWARLDGGGTGADSAIMHGSFTVKTSVGTVITIDVDTAALHGYFVRFSDSTVKYITPTQLAAFAYLSSISSANSVAGNGTPASPLQLAGDAASPGASVYYGTNGTGAKGYYSLPSGVAGANPTASIGFSPVNGTASTFTRSDAAPKFDTTALNIHTDGFNRATYKAILDSGYGKTSNYETIGGSQKRVDSLGILIGGKQPTGNYLTGLSGDVTATGPGTVPATVVGIQGHALPTLSAGYPHWNGSAWVYDTPAGGGGGSPGGTTNDVQINTGVAFGAVANFKANPSTHLVSMDSISASRHRGDSVLFNWATLWTPAQIMNTFGDSYTYGVSATPVTLGYAYKAATYFDLPLYNYGLNSSGALTSVSRSFAAEGALGTLPFSTYMFGFNDFHYASYANYRTNRRVWNSLASCIANHYLKNWVAAGSGAGSITTYGTAITTPNLSNIPSKSGRNGGLGLQMAALNDSVVYSFTDSTVGVGLIGSDSVATTYSTFDVYADNSLVGHYSANAQTDGSYSPGDSAWTKVPIVVVVRGLSFGPHKLKVVETSANPLVVDYFGSFLPLKNSTQLAVYEMPKMDPASYSIPAFPASDAITDTINGRMDSVVAIWQNQYANTFLVKTNNYYLHTTASGDFDGGIHPTAQGHTHIANGLDSTVNKFFPQLDNNVVAEGQHLIWYNNKTGHILDGTVGDSTLIQISGPNHWPLATYNLQFDYTNNRLGVGLGRQKPQYNLHVYSSRAALALNDSLNTTGNSAFVFNYGDAAAFSLNRDNLGNFTNNTRPSGFYYMNGPAGHFYHEWFGTPAGNVQPPELMRLTENAHLLVGGNVADSAAWLQLSPSSFTNAQIYFRPGTQDITTLRPGYMWYDTLGTDALYFVNKIGVKQNLLASGGGGGTGCLNCNADSLKHYPIDTSAAPSNGHVLAFDSTNHKWYLAANGSGTFPGSLGNTQIAVGNGTNNISGSANLTYVNRHLIMAGDSAVLQQTSTGSAVPSYFANVANYTMFSVNSEPFSASTVNTSYGQARIWAQALNSGGKIAFQTSAAANSTVFSRMTVFPSGNISIGYANPTDTASSLFTMSTTTAGWLPNRLTTVQQNAIASPALYLTVFNTDSLGWTYYNGSGWRKYNAAGSSGSGITGIGSFSGSSQTNGAGISGSNIFFGPADATNPGMIPASGAQTIGATWTLNNKLTLSTPSTSQASIKFTSSGGTAPTTPGAGDTWFDGTALNFYTGSSTINLLSAGGGGGITGSGAANQMGVWNGTSSMTGYSTNIYVNRHQKLYGDSAILQLSSNSSDTTSITSTGTYALWTMNANPFGGGIFNTAHAPAAISMNSAATGGGSQIDFYVAPAANASYNSRMRLFSSGDVYIGGNNNPTDTSASALTVQNAFSFKGVLMPRMTAAQFSGISSKPSGLLAIATDSNYRPIIYNGTKTIGLVTTDMLPTGGAYIPTLNNAINATSLVADSAFWTINNNIVRVQGELTLNATSASTGTTVDISIPVASHFGSKSVWGIGQTGSVTCTFQPAIFANTSTNKATVSFIPNNSGSVTVYYEFTYIVQ